METQLLHQLGGKYHSLNHKVQEMAEPAQARQAQADLASLFRDSVGRVALLASRQVKTNPSTIPSLRQPIA